MRRHFSFLLFLANDLSFPKSFFDKTSQRAEEEDGRKEEEETEEMQLRLSSHLRGSKTRQTTRKERERKREN